MASRPYRFKRGLSGQCFCPALFCGSKQKATEEKWRQGEQWDGAGQQKWGKAERWKGKGEREGTRKGKDQVGREGNRSLGGESLHF